MIPGPDQVIACPSCKGLAKYGTLVSGNLFGAKAWTDGKQVALMYPEPPPVVKCKHCGDFYWLTEADEVGTLDPWREPASPEEASWVQAEYVQEPTEQEYYEALRKNLARTREEERNLRVLTWCRRNDRFRDRPASRDEGQGDLSSEWRANLQALVSLLDEADENDCIMKAEALRHLERFQEAMRILDQIRSPQYSAIVSKIRSLCETGDTCVREIRLPA